VSDKPDATHKSLVELSATVQCLCTMPSAESQILSAFSQDPEYAHRLEMLPSYQESLHLRYPPVCEACLPAVEDEIRKKDHMARTKALGGWLQESKGRDMQRRVLDTRRERERFDVEIIAWRLRGMLWAVTLSLVLVVNSIGECLRPLPVSYLLPSTRRAGFSA